MGIQDMIQGLFTVPPQKPLQSGPSAPQTDSVGRGGVFDDTPTTQQDVRDILRKRYIEKNTDWGLVAPPDVFSPGSDFAGRIISPNTTIRPAMNPEMDMPNSFGAGRNKILFHKNPIDEMLKLLDKK